MMVLVNFLHLFRDCADNCLNDADEDDVCDEEEIVGCQDVSACNFDHLQLIPGSCDYPPAGYDCAW